MAVNIENTPEYQQGYDDGFEGREPEQSNEDYSDGRTHGIEDRNELDNDE